MKRVYLHTFTKTKKSLLLMSGWKDRGGRGAEVDSLQGCLKGIPKRRFMMGPINKNRI